MLTTNKYGYVTVEQDISRFGVNVHINGIRVIGTWAMSRAKALERFKVIATDSHPRRGDNGEPFDVDD